MLFKLPTIKKILVFNVTLVHSTGGYNIQKAIHKGASSSTESSDSQASPTQKCPGAGVWGKD